MSKVIKEEEEEDAVMGLWRGFMMYNNWVNLVSYHLKHTSKNKHGDVGISLMITSEALFHTAALSQIFNTDTAERWSSSNHLLYVSIVNLLMNKTCFMYFSQKQQNSFTSIFKKNLRIIFAINTIHLIWFRMEWKLNHIRCQFINKTTKWDSEWLKCEK